VWRPLVPVGPDRLPGEVKVWDAKTGKVLMDLKGHTGGVCAVAYNPDGTRILTGGVGMTVKVWDAATEIPLRELGWKEESPGHRVNGIALSRAGDRLLVSDSNGVTRVCDARIRAPRVELKARAEVLDAAYSPDGARIATGNSAGAVNVWDAKTGKVLLEVKRHAKPVTSVAYSPDGTRIVSVGRKFDEPGEVTLWDATTRRFLFELKGDGREVTSVAFNADGTRIVATNLERGKQVWDATTGRVRFPRQWPSSASARTVASSSIWVATGPR
jgi:WD40 repeat protein